MRALFANNKVRFARAEQLCLERLGYCCFSSFLRECKGHLL